MRCQNCGYENDPDAKFCEKCGSNLNKSNMPASTKILIVVVIVLVAGLGLVSGMMLMNNQAKPVSNNTTVNITKANNTTSGNSNNSQPTNQIANSSSNNGGTISESEAESIALNYVKANEDPQGFPVAIGDQSRPGGPADYEQYGPGPHDFDWEFSVDVGNQQDLTQYVRVNAYTGQVI
jgi:predicted nucleic acid-binding Zn ribbon protein